MTAKDTLIKARELLQVPGVWDTGVLVMDSCMCLLGAVAVAEGFIPADSDGSDNFGLYDADTVYKELEESPAVAALVANIPQPHHHHHHHHRSAGNTKVVYRFNDHPTRKLEDVLELLDTTIASVV